MSAGYEGLNFRKGQEAMEQASASNFSNPLDRVDFWGIEDAEESYVRFITDVPDWITVDMFWAPTKPAPDGQDNWPASMPAVDRYDPAFKGVYDDNWVVDNKIKNQWGKEIKGSPRTWAWAVLREPVIQDGQRVGFRTSTKTVEVDGDNIEVKAFVMVNMGKQNFFGPLAGIAGHYGTALDRDYLIKRKGKGKETQYTFIGMDQIILPEGNSYGVEAGTVLDLRVPEIAKAFEPPQPLSKVIFDRTTDEYYSQWFIPDAAAGGHPPTTEAASAATSSDVDPERLKAMREHIQASAAAGPPTGAAQPAGGMQDFS